MSNIIKALPDISGLFKIKTVTSSGGVALGNGIINVVQNGPLVLQPNNNYGTYWGYFYFDVDLTIAGYTPIGILQTDMSGTTWFTIARQYFKYKDDDIRNGLIDFISREDGLYVNPQQRWGQDHAPQQLTIGTRYNGSTSSGQVSTPIVVTILYMKNELIPALVEDNPI